MNNVQSFTIKKDAKDIISGSFFFAEKDFFERFNSEATIFFTTNETFYKLADLEKNILDFINKIDSKFNLETDIKELYSYFSNNKYCFLSDREYFFRINETKGALLTISVRDFYNIAEEPAWHIAEIDFEEEETTKEKEIKRLKDGYCRARINYLSNCNDTEIIKNFFQNSLSKEIETKKYERECNMITITSNGFKLLPFNVNNIEVDIDSNYNDDFKIINNKILSELNTRNKTGIILLNGNPGTGKTSYLRYLTQMIEKKKVIYIQPDLINEIGGPSFTSFIAEHSNSIIIIEDAETILTKRELNVKNSAVSNLLNITDGIMGDLFKLQIICTFNCKISEIDPALRREGRMICEYDFKDLTLEKTNSLLQKVFPKENFISNKGLPLSQIYSFNELFLKKDDQHKNIGFKI